MDEGYFVFSGLNVPNGGMDDYYGHMRSIEMAQDNIEDEDMDKFDWCHIVDACTLTIVLRGYKQIETEDKEVNCWWEWTDEE